MRVRVPLGLPFGPNVTGPDPDPDPGPGPALALTLTLTLTCHPQMMYGQGAQMGQMGQMVCVCVRVHA